MQFFRSWLALLPLFFPLYLVRFEVGVPGFGSIPTTLLEVLVGATATAMAGQAVGGVWRLGWRESGRIFFGFLAKIRADGWAGPLGPMLLFLIAAGVSMFFVPDQTIAIDGRVVESFRIAQGIWKGWIVMPIVYFLMVYWARLTPRDWLLSKHALLFSGLVLAGWGIVQAMSGEFKTWDGRASGPFESANYLALYLGPVVVLAGLGRPLFRTVLMVLGFLILAAGLYATKSYAAFIAVLAGFLFYRFFAMAAGGSAHFLKRRWQAIGMVALVGIALAAMQWNTPKFQQFLDFEGRSSSTVRLEVYQVAWAMIKENPVRGIGLGQFEVQYALRAPEVLGHAPYEWVMLHPHNLALAFWLNTGVLGLIAMVWLVAGCFWRGWRRLQKDPAAAHRILLALSLLLVILVHGLFDTPFFKNDLAYLWWWVVALGV